MLSRSARIGQIHLRVAVVLVAFLVTSGVLVSIASAADVTATIAGPTCGKDVQIQLSSTRASRVRFQIMRSDRTAPLQEVYVAANGSMTVTALADVSTRIFSVRADNKVIASKTVSRSATPCPAGEVVLPSVKSGISAEIAAPTCGTTARVTLNNGTSNVVWYEIWRHGRSSADAIVALAPGQVSFATHALTANNQTVKVVWNGSTVTQKTVSPKPSCASTSTTSTSTSTSTSTTVKSTTTTTPSITTTTTLPPCTGLDTRPGWGCPLRVDNFDGTLLPGGTGGWSKYNDPNGYAPRIPNNIRVGNGELQIVGTYDRASGTIMGAGVQDNYAQLYGRWEVRMRVDVGAGYSAAGLLWPNSRNWPTDGEIDLYEIPKAPRQQVMSVVHNGPTNAQSGKWTGVDATQWHVYAVEWLPDRVSFFIDGVEVLRETRSWLVPSTSSMQLSLQMDARRPADGCDGWYQCPDSTTPAETVMHVDSIKIWRR